MLFQLLGTYHEHGCLVGATVAIFHCGVLAAFDFGQFYVDLAWSAHAKQRTLSNMKMENVDLDCEL